MKKLNFTAFIVVLLSLLIHSQSFSQTNNCAFYTSTGTSSSGSSGIGPAGCNNFPGMVPTGVPVAWTGASCTGQITSTVVGPAVSCMTLTYSSVNTNDYATISTNTGGTLTLSGVNVGIAGNVIGPYNCSGSFGTVMVTVCSTVPFTSVTLLNTGCTSGWVINCSNQGTCSNSGSAGADNFSTVMCNGTIDLNTLVTGTAGGT